MVHYVIKKLPWDVCDAENENATEEEIRTTTLDNIDIDPGIEFEVGNGSCFRDDVPQIQIPFMMDGTTVNMRLHHEGKFKKTSYVGGKHFIVMGLDIESFSYSVLMELVKDNLHFTEIGVNIYIDNIVDKQIAPAPEMQPHMITRPRENFIQASPEKPLKRNENEKVTARRKLALEPWAGDVEDTGNKDVVEKLPPPPPLSEYLKFKKASCREDSEDTRIDIAEKLPPPSPLSMFLKRNMEKVKMARC
ncbi:hypothetical protein AgCh_000988 [Apium graveolens]